MGNTAQPTENVAVSAIDATIDYKLGVLRKILDRYSAPLVASEFGLSLAEWRVMSHIHAGELVTASWLCERLLADKAEVSRACGSLIGRNFVMRRKNIADGRSHLLYLSQSGRRLYDQILASRLALDTELTELLSEEQKGAFFSAMDILTAHMLQKLHGSDVPAGHASGDSHQV
jgi:DNA-binding MarR family transcriptional regulator